MNSLTRFFITMLLCGSLLAGCAGRGAVPVVDASEASYVDAQEVKLKVRELADQMLATVPNDALTGLVAVPTTFVNQDNFQSTNSFGRLVSESLYYEFNQRGFPVREYRLSPGITTKEGLGDFALSRVRGIKTSGEKWAALIVGTYYLDRDSVIVNARMVRASDGMVLRTGQLVMRNNAYVNRLTGAAYASSGKGGKNLDSADNYSGVLGKNSINIRQNPASIPVKRVAAAKKRAPGLWGTPVDSYQ